MVTIPILLTETQAQQLTDTAARLGLDPQDLARAAVVDLVQAPREEFLAVADAVVTANEELYRRLA